MLGHEHAGDLTVKGVEKALRRYRVVMIVMWVVLAGLCGLIALRFWSMIAATRTEDDLSRAVITALAVILLGGPLFLVVEAVLGVLLSHVCMGRFRRSGAILRLGYDARRLKKLDAEGVPKPASMQQKYDFQREQRGFANDYREQHGFLA